MVPGFQSPVSPYVYQALDSLQRAIRITVPYNNNTKVINASCTVHRDAGCSYNKIIVDVGPDGTPDTSPFQFNVSGLEGDRVFTVAQVNSIGLFTLGDVTAHQITAAP